MKSSASEPGLTEERFFELSGENTTKNNSSIKRFRKQLLRPSFIAPLLLNIIEIKYRKIPKISSGAYIFQTPIFEGLIFGGAYIRREACISKSTRLILGGKFASQIRLGELIVERKYMSVICRKFLLKLALRT